MCIVTRAVPNTYRPTLDPVHLVNPASTLNSTPALLIYAKLGTFELDQL